MKPGRKTSEFLIVCSVLLVQLGTALDGVVPARFAVICSSAVTVGYALSRGLAKAGGQGPGGGNR